MIEPKILKKILKKIDISRLRKVRFKPQGVAKQEVFGNKILNNRGGKEYIIHLVPVPKPRMTRNDFWKPGAVRYFKYADRLRSLAPSVQWNPLNIRFIMPMPKSWPNWKKVELNGKPHTRVPDLDNLVKAFKDALLENDCEVWKYGRILKVWGYGGGIAVTLAKGGDGVSV